MKALIIKISVTESELDYIHGFCKEIKELVIPELFLCVNNQYSFVLDKINFESRLSKGEIIQTIELNEELSEDLKQLVEIINSKEKIYNKLINEFNL